MKKIKLFSILAAFVAALSFTACNSDSGSSWKELTPTEKANCYSTLSMYNMTSPRGEFTYYTTKIGKDGKQTDVVSDSTITADWQISRVGSDTAIVVNIYDTENGITKALADYIPDYTNSKSNSGLKTALKEYQGSVTFICPVYFYQASPIAFLLNPKKLTYNLQYDGAAHKVDFWFYGSTLYSANNYGVYNPSSTTKVKMSMVFNLYGFKIDAADDDKSEPTRLEVKASNGTTNYVPYYFNVK